MMQEIGRHSPTTLALHMIEDDAWGWSPNQTSQYFDILKRGMRLEDLHGDHTLILHNSVAFVIDAARTLSEDSKHNTYEVGCSQWLYAPTW